MPRVNIHIVRAWRHQQEMDRIHYVSIEDGTERHRYVDAGSPLYDVLETELKAQNYTGPQAEKVN